MTDRIELTYKAVDEMIECHGKPKPARFGGGIWNAKEEFIIYKEQIKERYTPLQWIIISNYFKLRFNQIKRGTKRFK
jgi:hypothetical protein